jgi:hypothetical protein
MQGPDNIQTDARYYTRIRARVVGSTICDPNERALLEVFVQAIFPGGMIALERKRLHHTLQHALGVPVCLGRAVSGYETLGMLYKYTL